MSAQTVTNVTTTTQTERQVVEKTQVASSEKPTVVREKKPVLSAKYSKFLIFGYSLIQNLKAQDLLTDDTVERAYTEIRLMEEVDAQSDFYENYLSQSNETGKVMRKFIAQRNRAPKATRAKKEKKVSENATKRPRTKKVEKITSDQNADIVNELVTAATEVFPDNQTLLWNSISKLPAFARMPNKEEWFQNIIRHFYNSVSFNGNKMTVNELRKMNHDTISYMIKELKQPVTFSNSNTGSAIQNQSTFLSPNLTESHSYLSEQKNEQLNAQFTNRQDEYAAMLNKPPMPEINFAENSGDMDKPIDNMDELLQLQLKERSYDIQNLETLPQSKPQPQQPTKNVSFSDTDTNDLQEFMNYVRNELRVMRSEINAIKNITSIVNEPIKEDTQ